MDTDVNKTYCVAAIKALNNLKYYYESLRGDTVAYLKHYLPEATEEDLFRAVDWAISKLFVQGDQND